MNKIWLIIQREYLTRVRNRTFLITTILVPLLFVAFIFGSTYLSIHSKENLSVAVGDNSGFFKNNLENSDDVKFSFPAGVDSMNYAAKGYSAFLIIPENNNRIQPAYRLYAKETVSMQSRGTIKDKVDAAIENKLLQSAGIEKKQLDSIHSQSQNADLKVFSASDASGVKEDNQTVAYVIGYVCGILIYITMLIYGMMVMRGVMEEKTNRIAEVIISSVRPFQLMMGKIIGIGAVGLTQFLMWALLIALAINIAPHFIPHDTLMQMQASQQGGAMPGGAAPPKDFSLIGSVAGNVNWALILGCFVFYFICGYLFYASLFAAIGSVIDDVQNAQSLTLPITMPIIFSFIIMTNAVQNPDSSLALWGSLIPFSSPMVMMARIAYGVPETVAYWQLIVSMLLLVSSFLFTTWMAGKIYRTGILLYGKKPGWGQMMKWAFRKA